MQDVEKLERARAEMSEYMEQRFTKLSKKQEQKLKASDAKHEQVCLHVAPTNELNITRWSYTFSPSFIQFTFFWKNKIVFKQPNS